MLKICALMAIAIIPFVVSFPKKHLSTRETRPYQLYDHEFEFGVSLLKSATKSVPDKTFVVSPHSAYRTLILAYFGAEGSTKKSLSDGLQLRRNKDKHFVAELYDKEQEARSKRPFDKKAFFNTVDQLFVAQNVSLNPGLIYIIAEQFQEFDFSDPDTIRNELNDIVKEITENHLTDFIPNGLITAESKFTLANAAVFNAIWERDTHKISTKNVSFYGAVPTEVEMLEMHGKYYSGSYKDVTVVKVEFGEPASSVVKHVFNLFLYVPNKNTPTAIDDFLNNETGTSIKKSFGKFTGNNVLEVRFPKMFLESTFSLRNLTNDMDFKNIFGTESDYSDFTDSPQFQFEDILHKSKFELDEEITVLSAADVTVNVPVDAITTTKASAVKTNSKITSTELPDASVEDLSQHKVYCDRPFMFIAHDMVTQQILFTGIYRGPE